MDNKIYLNYQNCVVLLILKPYFFQNIVDFIAFLNMFYIAIESPFQIGHSIHD